MDKQSRLENLLGAFALSLTGAQFRAIARKTGQGESAAAAMITIGANPGISIALLAAAIGLTHSVAVRLVESLVKDGLVSRSEGRDRRQVLLKLSATGTRLRKSMLSAREALISEMTERLTAAEAEMLTSILARLTLPAICSRNDAEHFCRLCDEVACGGDDCPIEQKALQIERST